MRSLARALAIIATVLLVLPLGGCGAATQFRVFIPDLASANVEGIWFWQEIDGEFVRAAEIELGALVEQNGQEFLEYSLIAPTGEIWAELASPVERPEGESSGAELDLIVALFTGSGLYKASTYNDFGESSLSSGTVEVQI